MLGNTENAFCDSLARLPVRIDEPAEARQRLVLFALITLFVLEDADDVLKQRALDQRLEAADSQVLAQVELGDQPDEAELGNVRERNVSPRCALSIV